MLFIPRPYVVEESMTDFSTDFLICRQCFDSHVLLTAGHEHILPSLGRMLLPDELHYEIRFDFENQV